MNVLPPAFTDKRGKPVPYVPTQQEMENCRWAQIAISECPKPESCAVCSYHPQNGPRQKKLNIG